MTFLEAWPTQTEAGFMAQVIRYAEMMGWRCYHTRNSRKSTPGFPDLVLVRARHARPRVVFAELKGQRTPVTVDQADWIADLKAAGAEIYVWRPTSWRQVEAALR